MALLLPHERILLVDQLQEGARQNDQAAVDMANAIENGNVWHDNAEYDEVLERMKSIDSRFGHLAGLVRNATIVPYPEASFGMVAMGSLVEVRSDSDQFGVALVGQNFVGEERYKEAWAKEGKDVDDLNVSSPQTPLAAALLGGIAAEHVTYSVEGRQFDFEIVTVDQQWIRGVFADVLAAHAHDPAIAEFV